jgi:hypothetical protein
MIHDVIAAVIAREVEQPPISEPKDADIRTKRHLLSYLFHFLRTRYTHTHIFHIQQSFLVSITTSFSFSDHTTYVRSRGDHPSTRWQPAAKRLREDGSFLFLSFAPLEKDASFTSSCTFFAKGFPDRSSSLLATRSKNSNIKISFGVKAVASVLE